MGSQKISVLDEHTSGTKPADSFVVDMERFSNNLLEKDLAANSRIKLQRSLSRKGSVRSSERKPNPNAANENPIIATSPRAAPSTPEKLTVVTMGATDNSASQPHNQITIMAGGATPAESKLGGRRFSFRRPSSSPSWTIDPRRILLFFATLSSMGTMLLIYFTLSMGNLSGDESVLN
ncbi:uncharacterized protein LOC116032395 isoform X2 [Ipomoea triloba]|uniref:uncharacterized protein LOC116032395 isoform X2 n=1 Tax=Ipomoea triloba TaxID=35885 RepID=UPI00125E6CE1|nr:uncharacterized protein LOC116032395 isoform X2 [Ipomoea triloba]